ncbi:hypothetical protein EG240_06765 [Paenimyroides tangerinum]|uniref:AsmA-like C-terminal domain-containing protein n=1 Tax=Paenimyroides tangerinum TaxID=2488728 RepID=A0A3P3W7R1_9FLAO|nr:hypothetical protein [Paenimyroides tangerinum]RRJ91201.1 hypothetical protein EG240_06765 [Paenimyroides tangerinum]
MKLKKILKFFAIGIISLSLLAVVLSFALNYFINQKLPKIIEEKNDTEYNLKYEKIDFSVFKNTLSIHSIELTPKNLDLNPKKIHFNAKIETIGITGVDFYELLKNKNLNAFTIHLENPDIIVYKNKIQDTVKDKTKSKLPGSIDIDKIMLEHVNLKVVNSTGDTLHNQVFNLNAKIDVLKMGEYIESKSLPFTYSNYEFSVDSVFTRLNESQYLKADQIKINPSSFDLVNFRLLPLQNKKTFRDSHSKSQLEILVPKLNLKGTDWGIENEAFYLNISQINIDSVQFGILDKNKNITQNEKITSNKNTKSSIIPFKLDVDELNIKKSSFNSLNTFDVKNVNISIKGISNRINEKLHIKEFSLNKPQIIQVAKKSDKTKKKTNAIHLNDKLEIDVLKINDASYVLKDKSGLKNQITIQKFNLALNHIKVNEQTLSNKIPFTYENPLMNTGKIHYDTGDFYNVYTNGIDIKNNTVTISNLELKPKLSRAAFNSRLKYGTDLFNVSVANISLKNLNWGFDSKDVLFLKFSEVVLNKVNADIFRNAAIPNKPGLNKLYSQKLRDLKFGLDIPKVKILNSTLIYEEETAKSTAPGVLTFNNLNANIQNVYSGYGRKSGPKTIIEVNTNFMKTAKVGVNWSFDILNKSDAFNIRGTVLNLPAEGMNPFIKPYLKVSATGTIDEIDFDFNGNNDVASGTFSMNYDHLKMSLYKDDGEKKRKFLSTLANLVIKKNTHGKDVEHNTKPVERVKNKGFFSFFWLNLKQGLKQTLL